MPKTKFRVNSSDWEREIPVFTSITPLDGRNYHKIKILAEFFSEFALNRRRVEVEIRWLIFLSGHGFLPLSLRGAPIKSGRRGNLLQTDSHAHSRSLGMTEVRKLEEIIGSFDLKDMAKVRNWEKKTNHDVKAIEYFLDDKFSKIGLKHLIGKLHWGLAAEDVNNLAVNLNIRDYVNEQLLPLIDRSLRALTGLILDSKCPMLGRTHGQPAEVTVLGKELAVFLVRLKSEIARIKQIKLQGKVAGAVGSFADQYFCFPSESWPKLTAKFVASLGLDPVTATTQILPYESLLVLFSGLSRLQNIAVDLVQNLWWYVSFGYFAQKKKTEEVGSSSMPQKINPIYLEGAEGGFEQSNALFEFYIRKLSKSRLQRDLSDSTVRRSFGIAFGFSYLSWQSLEEALFRLSPQPEVMFNDLNNHWEVLIGPVLSYLRILGYKQGYEFLVSQTRGKTLTRTTYQDLVSKLKLETKDSRKLKDLTPQSLIKPSLEVINEAVK